MNRDDDAAMKVRREVLGADHVDRADARTTEFARPFQEYITRAAWGAIWTRDGLDAGIPRADTAFAVAHSVLGQRDSS